MSLTVPCKKRIVSAAGGYALCLVMFCALVAGAADFRVQRWQAVEIVLTSSVMYGDPFQDVDVSATFTKPGSKAIVRPAFWDGGTTWKVRFAPPEPGLWTMTSSATDSTNWGLHGITETLQCGPYTGSLEIYRRGFLKVSSNGRYFTYADETPFFYLGDTHWTLSHERFDRSNAPGVASQFKYTVDKRVRQGFTVIQSEASFQTPSAGMRVHQEAIADEEADADLRHGLTSAALPGFANLDRKFKYIADQGLVHANAEICWVADPAAFASYTDAYLMRLARYWVARYGAYPVIWTIAQEVDKNYYGKYDSTTINKWFRVAQSIVDNDAYHHPIMPHMENTDSTTAANSWWSQKPFHSAWAVQWQGELEDKKTAETFWNALPVKPSVLYESAYDHFWTDSRGALNAAYKAFQYGMYGYGYGANGIWNDIYSKPGEPADFGTDYEMPQHFEWWRDGADLPTGDQLSHFKAFYTSLKWWTLVPRFNDHSWGNFLDASRSFLSSDGHGTYVILFTGSPTTPASLNQLDDNSTYLAKWFNPRNGLYLAISSVTPKGRQWVVPDRPTAEDWVLLVQRNTPRNHQGD